VRLSSKLPVERIRSTWENIEASLWFIPTMFAGFAVLLSVLLPELDRRVADDVGRQREWIFSGTADAARTILSVIAGSLITVISLLFSITVLTLQQASTQFSPRVMRKFTSDRGSQNVLGIYIATFLYALLVLRQIQGEDSPVGTFIPILSVTVAIIFALICMGALVYFIHHIANLLQASTIIQSIQHELLDAIDHLYPAKIGEPVDLNDPHDPRDDIAAFRSQIEGGNRGTIVGSTSAGYLRSLDESGLAAALPEGAWAIVHAPVGHFVIRGTPLVEVGGVDIADDEQYERLNSAFVLDRQRSLSQDPLFAVRQLVDIALKALSPAINDPTTAEHVISALGDGLARLMVRPFPSRIRVIEHDGQHHACWINRPRLDEYVAESFDQIRRIATDNVHVTLYLLDTIAAIGPHAPVERWSHLCEQVDAIVEAVQMLDVPERDMRLLQERIDLVRDR